MIKEIELKNFRRFKSFKCSINNNLVIFLGSNACGKTTILESIYLISKNKSHRTNDLINLINNESEYAVINLFSKNDHYCVILSNEGKKAMINNIEYKKMSDFIGNIKTVMFSPNDMNLIYGSKSIRRLFIDLELSILNKNYLYEIKVYKKLLKERNEILKNYKESNKKILDIVTADLIKSNKKILEYRINFIDELNSYIKKLHYDLYKEMLYIKYKPSVDINNIEKSYENKLSYDILTKMTNVGIHRDDFTFILNNKEALNYVSQGQARSIVLSLKMALFYLIKKDNDDVILLLDDVFSELDSKRQTSLVSFLNTSSQTFITTTSLDLIPSDILKSSLVINLDKGENKDGK